MQEFLSSLVNSIPLLSAKSTARIFTDDVIFRLHYLITARALFAAAIASVFLLLFDWIDCYDTTGLPSNIIKIYCWMQNTFILPGKVEGIIGEDIAHPGIDAEQPGDEKAYITYYQWLPLFLLFQGSCFQIGHFLWKKTEHFEMRNFTTGFQYPIAIDGDQGKKMSAGDIERNLNLLSEVILKGINEKQWKYRPLRYIISLTVNCLNCFLQIYFTNLFFNIGHISIGWDLYENLSQHYFLRTDELVSIFPRTVKCIYHQFGSGGSVQAHDILCMLPFNVYTEKFFAACQIWFYFMTAISLFALLFWLLIFIIRPLRILMGRIPIMKMMSHEGWRKWVEGKNNPKEVKKTPAKRRTLQAGNWFVMWLISKNMHCNHLDSLLKLLENETLNENHLNNSSSPLIENANNV